MTAKTVYTLTNDNELKVEMRATTDKTTLVNMAHHSYWNLGGHNSGTILDHELTLYADQYTPGTPMVPDGRMHPVKGTPFDFTSAKAIGRDLKQAGGAPIGYDHNFVVNGVPNQLRPVARLKDPKSGRVMTVSADQPGVQFYTGNFLDGSASGKGAAYVQYAALCLETQKFPNAINVPAWEDQVIVRPGADLSPRDGSHIQRRAMNTNAAPDRRLIRYLSIVAAQTASEQLVGHRADQDDGAHHREIERARNVEQVHQIAQHLQQRRAHDDPEHGSFASAQAAAADDGRGNRVELVEVAVRGRRNRVRVEGDEIAETAASSPGEHVGPRDQRCAC